MLFTKMPSDQDTGTNHIKALLQAIWAELALFLLKLSCNLP